VQPEGQLVFNTITLSLTTALAGLRLAYLPEDQVREHLAASRLVHVLSDRSPVSSDYHLYYPSRRHLNCRSGPSCYPVSAR
jgi:DNA-binding transcriptional LysR family regulator